MTATYQLGLNRVPKECRGCDNIRIEDHGIAGIFYCERDEGTCPRDDQYRGVKVPKRRLIMPEEDPRKTFSDATLDDVLEMKSYAQSLSKTYIRWALAFADRHGIDRKTALLGGKNYFNSTVKTFIENNQEESI